VHILTYDAGLYPTRVSSYRLGRDAPQDYVYIYSHVRYRSVPGICRKVGIEKKNTPQYHILFICGMNKKKKQILLKANIHRSDQSRRIHSL